MEKEQWELVREQAIKLSTDMIAELNSFRPRRERIEQLADELRNTLTHQ